MITEEKRRLHSELDAACKQIEGLKTQPKKELQDRPSQEDYNRLMRLYQDSKARQKEFENAVTGLEAARR